MESNNFRYQFYSQTAQICPNQSKIEQNFHQPQIKIQNTMQQNQLQKKRNETEQFFNILFTYVFAKRDTKKKKKAIAKLLNLLKTTKFNQKRLYIL